MNLKIRFRRFAAKYLGFFVALVYSVKFKFLNFTNPPIIILTPGKVGSSSIYSSLKANTNFPVFHIHNLSEEGINGSVKHHMTSDRKSKPLHLIISKLLRKKLRSYNGPLFVISVIREPVSRELSSFFQNIDFYKSELENQKLEIDIEKAHNFLNKRFETDICKDLEDWFNLEIRDNFGLDVFDQPFDFHKKYTILENNKTSLLLLRMEDLNAVFSLAIQEFLDLEAPLELQNENIGNAKHYAQSYQTIKDKFILEPSIAQNIVQSKFFKHFYASLQDKVLKRWTKNN